MANGTPKPLSLVKGHRTKAEIAIREKAEKSLLTGIALKEWPEVKSNPVAHKEYIRIKRAFKAIDKDDTLHESVVNRYCLLHAECKQMEELKQACGDDLQELHDAYKDSKMEFMEYIDRKQKIQERFLAYDKKIMDKRKAMLDIEKENIMTVQSAMRSIPKKPEEKPKSSMAAYLAQRQAGKNGT
jgi:hypothetical protein